MRTFFILIIVFLAGCGTSSTNVPNVVETHPAQSPSPRIESDSQARIDEDIKYLEAGFGGKPERPQGLAYMIQKYTRPDKLKDAITKLDPPRIDTWPKFEATVEDLSKIDQEDTAYVLDMVTLFALRQWWTTVFQNPTKADSLLHNDLFNRYCKRLNITNLNPLNAP